MMSSLSSGREESGCMEDRGCLENPRTTSVGTLLLHSMFAGIMMAWKTLFHVTPMEHSDNIYVVKQNKKCRTRLRKTNEF